MNFQEQYKGRYNEKETTSNKYKAFGILAKKTICIKRKFRITQAEFVVNGGSLYEN